MKLCGIVRLHLARLKYYIIVLYKNILYKKMTETALRNLKVGNYIALKLHFNSQP